MVTFSQSAYEVTISQSGTVLGINGDALADCWYNGLENLT